MSAVREQLVEIVLERGDKGLGFNIKGGKDAHHVENEAGIFVAKIREGGAAANHAQLKEGDKILEINGKSLDCVSHEEAVNTFRTSGNLVRLTVIPGAEKRLREQLKKKQLLLPTDSDSRLNAPLIVIGLAVVAVAAFAGYKYLQRNS